MFYHLPPAGNRICLAAGARHPETYFRPYRFYPYGSGTTALAAAIRAAIQLKQHERPEVILPAYGCPDLVSAVLHARARPVLVDMEPGRPWLDLGQLESKITRRTVAVVAVRLFGIPERGRELRAIAESAGVLLIDDSAQWLPCSGSEGDWQGDFVVLSFGRGKPVSLLAGGAVLCRNEELAGCLPNPAPSGSGSAGGNAGPLMKLRLYNWLISPRRYWLPSALPFLRLGETRYQPLTAITPFPAGLLPLLSSNIDRYCDRRPEAQLWLREMLASLRSDAVSDLARACDARPAQRLLRYPVLMARPASRDRLLRRLHAAGLGGSAMYPAPLNRIKGLDDLLDRRTSYVNAQRFADTILTLPTHEAVRRSDIARMGDLFGDVLRD